MLKEELFRQEALDGIRPGTVGRVSMAFSPLLSKMIFAITVLAVGMLALVAGLTYTRREVLRGFLQFSAPPTQILSSEPVLVAEIFVSAGEPVLAGQQLFRLARSSGDGRKNATRSSSFIYADRAGIVQALSVEPGQSLDTGQRIATFQPTGDGIIAEFTLSNNAARILRRGQIITWHFDQQLYGSEAYEAEINGLSLRHGAPSPNLKDSIGDYVLTTKALHLFNGVVPADLHDVPIVGEIELETHPLIVWICSRLFFARR